MVQFDTFYLFFFFQILLKIYYLAFLTQHYLLLLKNEMHPGQNEMYNLLPNCNYVYLSSCEVNASFNEMCIRDSYHVDSRLTNQKLLNSVRSVGCQVYFEAVHRKPLHSDRVFFVKSFSCLNWFNLEQL